ncbi:MAG TPA: hypothetical protein VIQ76_01095, partial [Propionibacteriaceae bacterium]
MTRGGPVEVRPVMERVARSSAQARWLIIEGVLDTELKHRQLLRANLRDMALSAAQPVFIRFRDAMLR